jgi:DHA2 family multidrug resistance protein
MLPPCAVALFLALRFVPETAAALRRKLDVGGFLSISIAVASIQLCLGRIGGQASVAELATETAVFLVSLAYFIVHTSRTEHGLFEPGLLKDRNFFAAMLVTFLLFFTSYATVILTPLLLTDIHETDNLVIGMLMLPRAVGNVAGVAAAAALNKLFGPRTIIALGVSLMAAAVLEFALLDPGVSSLQVATAGLVQGLGLGLASVPLNVQAFATLPTAARNDASAVRMIFRTIGGSLGIAAVISVITVTRQRGGSDWPILIPLRAVLGDTGDPILDSYRLAFLLLMTVTGVAMCMIMLFGAPTKTAAGKT